MRVKRPGQYLEVGHKMAYTALVAGKGERKSLTRYEVDVSGDCERPSVSERHWRPSPRHRRKMTEAQAIRHPLVAAALAAFPGSVVGHVRVPAFTESKMITVDQSSPLPVTVQLTARCRKCPRCLRVRARLWFARARAEVAKSSRTWFGTLTLSDESYFRFVSQTRHRLFLGGTDLDALPAAVRFGEINREIGIELQKYLKRVRKQSEAKLRYILVAEAHKSGKHHYHALVHECEAAKPVRKIVLDGQWNKTMGFTQWRLVHKETSEDVNKAAWYVCKYVSKDAAARVRASSHYGASS